VKIRRIFGKVLYHLAQSASGRCNIVNMFIVRIPASRGCNYVIMRNYVHSARLRMDVANNMQQGWLASVDEVDAGVFRILT
jgi:hypothetical protein